MTQAVPVAYLLDSDGIVGSRPAQSVSTGTASEAAEGGKR
jgi:hypothetical protein